MTCWIRSFRPKLPWAADLRYTLLISVFYWSLLWVTFHESLDTKFQTKVAMRRGPQVHTFYTSLLQVSFHDFLDTKFLTKVAMGRRPHIHILFLSLLYICSIVRTFFWIYILQTSSHKQTHYKRRQRRLQAFVL